MKADLSEERRRAWETRRRNHGPRGHLPYRYGHPKHAAHPQFRTSYHELPEEERAKSRARAYANVYQKRGLLVPEPCEDCGAEKVEKHHADYSKPLEVTWLCRPCHYKRHFATDNSST